MRINNPKLTFHSLTRKVLSKPWYIGFISLFICFNIFITQILNNRLLEILGYFGGITLIAYFLYFLLRLFIRNSQKAGLLVVIFMLLFFQFSLLGNLIITFLINKAHFLQIQQLSPIGRQYLMLVVFTVVFLGIACLILRVKIQSKPTTIFMNVTAIIMVLLLIPQAIQIAETYGPDYPDRRIITEWEKNNAPLEQPGNVSKSELPDIYFILLDGFSNEEVMQSTFDNYDNPLYEYLRSRHFYIAANAQANYVQTRLGFSSVLNMDYIDSLLPGISPTTQLGYPTDILIQENQVMKTFKHLGYSTVAIGSSSDYTDFRNADYYFAIPNNLRDPMKLLFTRTPLSVIFYKERYRWHYNQIDVMFQELSNTTSIPGPKLVFLHVPAPHPPFIYTKDGTLTIPPREFTLSDAGDFFTVGGSLDEFLTGYATTANITGEKLTVALETIFENASQPPVILVQGDHGDSPAFYHHQYSEAQVYDRTHILSAYYFPDQDYSLLSPDHLAVNSFRVIFNKYYNAQLPMLEKQIYYSTMLEPFNFTDITLQSSQKDR